MFALNAAATILHADLDAFYASVEQRDDPTLRGRPVIVGGGVVLAASYEARALGVRTAMGGSQARRLCPHAAVVSPRMSAYSDASKAVFEIFEDMSPLVEALSIDEAFLDVRGLERIKGTPLQIAVALRRAVRERVGLPITVGVARTKFLAKVASGVAKPDGLLMVPPAAELAFLHPLPVERLWGVGKVTSQKLREHRPHDRRSGSRIEPDVIGGAARSRLRPASACARAQPRPEARRAPPATKVDRRAARAGAAPKITAGADHGADRARRARHPPVADGSAAVPDDRAADALRRLRARDALTHAARADGAHGHDPEDRDGASAGVDADD